jgi:hypothetical protein
MSAFEKNRSRLSRTYLIMCLSRLLLRLWIYAMYRDAWESQANTHSRNMAGSGCHYPSSERSNLEKNTVHRQVSRLGSRHASALLQARPALQHIGGCCVAATPAKQEKMNGKDICTSNNQSDGRTPYLDHDDVHR